MSRAWMLMLVLFGYGGAVGCNACGTPFDYCSPTFNGRGAPSGGCGPCGDTCGDGCGDGCGDDCRENVRLGSILSDNGVRGTSYYEPAQDDSVPPRREPTPAEDLPPPDEAEEPQSLPPVPRMDERIPPADLPVPELSDEPTELEPLEAPRSSLKPPRTLRR